MRNAFLANKQIKRYLLVVAFIILSNFQPLKFFFATFIEPFCTTLDYATPSGGFMDDEIPLMARKYDGIARRFDSYKLEHPSDTILYRLYRINPIMFWEWSDMFTHPKYRLPYLNPKEIPTNSR